MLKEEQWSHTKMHMPIEVRNISLMYHTHTHTQICIHTAGFPRAIKVTDS